MNGSNPVIILYFIIRLNSYKDSNSVICIRTHVLISVDIRIICSTYSICSICIMYTGSVLTHITPLHNIVRYLSTIASLSILKQLHLYDIHIYCMNTRVLFRIRLTLLHYPLLSITVGRGDHSSIS